jgi:hypothetical protein
VDLYSGRVTIVGILDRFDLQAFPGQTKQCMAFMQLSGGIGRCQIIIDIEDLEDGQTIARARGPGIEFPDRLSRINLIIDLPPIPLEHPGLYDLVVLSNNEEIDRQRFRARSLTSEGDVDDGGEDEENDGEDT